MYSFVPTVDDARDDFLPVEEVDALSSTLALHLSIENSKERTDVLSAFINYCDSHRRQHVPWSKTAYAFYELMFIAHNNQSGVHRANVPVVTDSAEKYLFTGATPRTNMHSNTAPILPTESWRERWTQRANTSPFEPRLVATALPAYTNAVVNCYDLLQDAARACNGPSSIPPNLMCHAWEVAVRSPRNSPSFILLFDLTAGLAVLSNSYQNPSFPFLQELPTDSRFHFTVTRILQPLFLDKPLDGVRARRFMQYLDHRYMDLAQGVDDHKKWLDFNY